MRGCFDPKSYVADESTGPIIVHNTEEGQRLAAVVLDVTRAAQATAGEAGKPV